MTNRREFIVGGAAAIGGIAAVGDPVRSMLGARGTASIGGGGAPTARDYVQNGLIAMWDGIENAGWGVHDAAATVWADLVGGYDLTIIGSVQPNNVQGDATVASRRPAIDGIQTVEVCARLWRIGGNELMFCSGPTDQSRLGVVSYSSTIVQTMAGKFWSLAQANNQLMTISATNDSCFADGVQLAPLTHGADTWNNGSVVGIGGRESRLYAAPGEYYSVRLYSRTLTAAEIAYNNAIDKERFGLP